MQQRSLLSKHRLFTYAANCALFLGITFYTTYVFAHSTGITGVTKKNGAGCTCHDPSPTASVLVTINGPSELTPGQTGSYTVTIRGGPAVRGGTNIAASGGTLNSASSALQKIGDELTHVSPQPFDGGTITFPFTYTAPNAAGIYTIYANGNSVNFNGDNTGDQWNFAPNKSVTVKTTSSAERSSTALKGFSLSQNYPNPFNPSTTITYDIARAGDVDLHVYDISGRPVQALVNGLQQPGSHRVRLISDGLPSGTYFCVLRVDGVVVASRTMTLLK